MEGQFQNCASTIKKLPVAATPGRRICASELGISTTSLGGGIPVRSVYIPTWNAADGPKYRPVVHAHDLPVFSPAMNCLMAARAHS